MKRTSPNIIRQHVPLERSYQQQMNGHRSTLLWLTGLSGAGKTTLARAVEGRLHALGARCYVLDGDSMRQGLCGDLAFSAVDRSENIRRIGEVSKLFVDAGMITLSAFISPFRKDRERVRALLAPGDFVEIYCRCPLEVCERRDVKGLYKLARAGKLAEFTGISSPYEEPESPELTLDCAELSVEQATAQVMDYLRNREIVSSGTDR